jgi:hypothetical protein
MLGRGNWNSKKETCIIKSSTSQRLKSSICCIFRVRASHPWRHTRGYHDQSFGNGRWHVCCPSGSQRNCWTEGEICESQGVGKVIAYLAYGILETRKHNVSETGYVSVLRWGETPALLIPLEKANLKGTQQSKCLHPHLRTETDPVSETLCFLVFRIPADS